ncbi:hypothetical protein F4561_004206 [Lipingzhangella halophila]|uniref:Sulfotransferase family protein n=1 Tax=Lipingzhangella halophila TaxID=1783352 RepID=A0A7W7RKV7_9ACTN|nr:sulfotransferase family protein [Lipingzhangella halophila]MBB4933386.1 hypothetical protein [Lipingzhangella halophila]
MVQVIGAGFPRTGTSSLKVALEQLGFGPCHHMFEVMGNPEPQSERWIPVLSAANRAEVDWDFALQGYNASVDWPSSFFWRELAAAYPEAKVILTVRDPRRWYASLRDSILRFMEVDDYNEAPEPMRSMGELGNLINDTLAIPTFGDVEIDEERAVEVFERHTADVRASLPADRLLVFEVSQGWQPLCDFLGVEAPAEPFPRLNDTETMQRMFQNAMESGELITPFDVTRDGSGSHGDH